MGRWSGAIDSFYLLSCTDAARGTHARGGKRFSLLPSLIAIKGVHIVRSSSSHDGLTRERKKIIQWYVRHKRQIPNISDRVSTVSHWAGALSRQDIVRSHWAVFSTDIIDSSNVGKLLNQIPYSIQSSPDFCEWAYDVRIKVRISRWDLSSRCNSSVRRGDSFLNRWYCTVKLNLLISV